MIPIDKPNPFSVLGLPVDATRQDIVERGQELHDLADTEESRLLYRWATEELITNPIHRLQYELFELPGAVYENAEWDRFCRRYRRPPVRPETLLAQSQAPQIGDFNIHALFDLVVDGLLDAPEVDVSDVAAHNPFAIDPGPPPLEITDVLFG